LSVGGGTLCGVSGEIPAALLAIAHRQGLVVSRGQAIRAGMSRDAIRSKVRSRKWQPLYPGVYALFTGPPHRMAQLWAAVLWAGPDAVLSYETAAELNRLIDKPVPAIHITVPASRRVRPVRGIVVHLSSRGVGAAEYTWPLRTRVEETVLDLTQAARSFDDVCGWVTQAMGRMLTTDVMLKAAMSVRRKMCWRKELTELIDAAAGGADSVLEFRYDRDVERAHGLPAAERQVPFAGPGGRRGRRDRVYEKYGVVVELDGRLAHPAENQWKDKARDNAAAAEGKQSLRYGWMHGRWKACATATEVARVLRLHGWDGWPRPCSPGCPVRPE
jgi:hypothetical protein